jgi:enoyl-CoA hydratase/3-hydroxyacyl-CoA dehydrogenase
VPRVSDQPLSGPAPDPGWEERPVKLETRGAVAIAWLDRPPANSLAPATLAALRAAWEAVEGDGAVRALVVASANPRLFCAGADIKAFATMEAADARGLVEDAHDLFRAFERSSVATVAAVNGLALGGGCELAMACDVRIAAAAASFGQPEIRLGLVPGFGGTQRLARLVGAGRALEMNLGGEPIPAEQALAWGLATRVVPGEELLDEALAWAERLATRAPLAIGEIKRLGAEPDFDAGLAAERDGFVDVFGSADAREGIAAFLDRREPRFEGR